ncbi:MAG: hypothetical protein E7667_00565 [Ruminococcaceae bacterium]|nr:hypothetical protein [Oscillospiraceae bacterium]
MTVKTQKNIIRFIPVVNWIITVIFWFRMMSKVKLPTTYIFKPLFKMIVLIVIVSIPRIICDIFVDINWVNTVVMSASTYLSTVIMASIFVSEQEKHPIEQDNTTGE